MIEAILVLGMHRSGTSCLTGCLKSFGLELGSVSEFNKNNQKGNQENRQVFLLNEQVFEFNQGSWFSPPPGPLKWTSEHEVIREAILRKYRTLPKPWGMKDPRMIFAFDFWQYHLPKTYQLIGTFRHPLSVAQSLAARKKLSIPIEEGLKLWNAYNLRLLELHAEHGFEIINFDLPENQYLLKIDKIAKNLGLLKSPTESFFDFNLKNQAQHRFEECPEDLVSTYQKLIQASIN